jgi:hypothetical protein
MIAMYHLSHLIVEGRRLDLIAGGPRISMSSFVKRAVSRLSAQSP